jgi:hypothetical protein
LVDNGHPVPLRQGHDQRAVGGNERLCRRDQSTAWLAREPNDGGFNLSLVVNRCHQLTPALVARYIRAAEEWSDSEMRDVGF